MSATSRPADEIGRLLDVDDAFAVTTFAGFRKKNYPASEAVVDALQTVTSSGATLLVAGCLLWVARRLEKVTDVSRCHAAAEALLCYQDSPAYLRPTTLSEWPAGPEVKNDAERAVEALSDQLYAVYAITPGRHALPPGVLKRAGATVTMVRAVLGAGGKKPFEAWLATVLERLKIVAENPRVRARAALPDPRFSWDVERAFKRENVGPPLPPEILDPRQTDASDLGERYAAFLGAVDWAKNPFLASPELMKERGFAGRPYVPTPGATYPESAPLAPISESPTKTPEGPSPYRFLETLDAMPKGKRKAALHAYVASRALPANFGRQELLLEHAFRLMLGRPVVEAKGLHVGILEASIDVVGDLSIVIDDVRPRSPALRGFEPSIEVFDVEQVRSLVGPFEVRTREPESAPLVAIRKGDTLIARLTREELADIADDLHDHVSVVRLVAPSDGTLFEALRYMVQQEAQSWGMSNILDASDMLVERVDGKLEAALAAVEDEDLARELSAFCDANGRSARAWRWTGKDSRLPDGTKLRFAAGVYDGEGVGFEFNVYCVEER